LPFAGPHGPLFLAEQLRAARSGGIPVYWASGPSDGPERWPWAAGCPRTCIAWFAIDRNRTSFARRPAGGLADRHAACGVRTPSHAACRWNARSCNILSSRMANMNSRTSRPRRLLRPGGRQYRSTLRDTDDVAHHAGTHQGRSFAELGFGEQPSCRWPFRAAAVELRGNLGPDLARRGDRSP
jgi:hypothetical protein